jgi:penicillin-binding protein 2
MIKFNRPQAAGTAREKMNKRLLVIYLFILLLFLILICRLFYLQVIKGNDYAERAESNIYRTITLPARRGTIYDINSNVLASSEPYMSISVYPDEVDDIDTLAENLAELFSRDDIFMAEQEARETIAKSTLSDAIEAYSESSEDGDASDTEEDINAATGSLTANTKPTKEEIYNILEEGMASYAAISVRTYTYDVGVTIAEIIAENSDDFTGVYVSEEPMRSYPFGFYLGHVLGTVGSITQSQLETMSSYGYSISAVVGQSGLENYYEYYTADGNVYSLSGEDGSRVVEVDAKNNIVDIISEEAPVAGDSLQLTIDLNTQMHMEDSLIQTIANIHENNSKCNGGSAVMIDVDTGAVLAMASAPSIDPNDFARGLTNDEFNYYFDETLTPQVNRAISSGYASGSTFKMMTATAILSAGISPEETVYCPGENEDPMADCWEEHGTVNFYDAVRGSCNTYFQTMAARVGQESMIDIGLKYGFGQKTGLDLPGEISGLLPTPEWKAQNYTGWESTWHTYDTYYMSIGQGATVDTVVQLASYVATIANDGERMKPYICQSILDDDGNVLKTFESEVVDTVDLDDEDWTALITAMEGVVGDENGTASNLFISLPDALMPAGKTGTAQTGLASDDSESDYHGVFIAFAPADDPEVAFAGLIEYGHHGGSSAGYVCRDAFRAYFGYDVDYDILLMDEFAADTIDTTITEEKDAPEDNVEE